MVKFDVGDDRAPRMMQNEASIRLVDLGHEQP